MSSSLNGCAIGVIKGFAVKIDPAKVGLPVSAVIEFQPRSNQDQAAINAVINNPAVRSCYRVTGSSLLVLIVRVASSGGLQDLLDQIMPFGETKTSVILLIDAEDRPLFADALPPTL